MLIDLHLAIIRNLCDREEFKRYGSVCDTLSTDPDIPSELRLLYNAIQHSQKRTENRNSNAITRAELEAEITIQSSAAPKILQSCRILLDRVWANPVPTATITELLQKIAERRFLDNVSLFANRLSNTKGTAKDLQEYITRNIPKEYSEDIPQEAFSNSFISSSLSGFAETQRTGGLNWRLNSLNNYLGPLHTGDFGFLFARPETGKTTFLCSEVTHFATQTTQPILWFNNEELSEKVLLRCYQASLGEQAHVILGNLPEYEAKFLLNKGGNIRFPTIDFNSKKTIELLLEHVRPSLIIFDQIDKINGFAEERNDLVLGSIYQWARNLARIYCPVIGICQAGQSGEGKKWLTMNDVDNSKTAKQGEADWILGIGKSLDDTLAFERYLHLSKNKLLGSPEGRPDMRHGKWAVRILPEIARYEDIT